VGKNDATVATFTSDFPRFEPQNVQAYTYPYINLFKTNGQMNVYRPVEPANKRSEQRTNRRKENETKTTITAI
jgi:hypothetical protein